MVWVGHGRCVGADDRGLFLSCECQFHGYYSVVDTLGEAAQFVHKLIPHCKAKASFAAVVFGSPTLKPVPVSLSCPSSARRVSLRAAMSTLYLASSRPTSAVLLSGLFACALCSRVRTFHEPKMNGFILIFCFLLFLPLVRDPRQPRRAGQGVRQAIFGTPFLVRSSCYGGEQCDPRKGCSVAQGAAESRSCLGLSERRPYGLSRHRAWRS